MFELALSTTSGLKQGHFVKSRPSYGMPNVSQAVRVVLNYLYKMSRNYGFDAVSLDMLRNALYDQRTVLEAAVALLVDEGLLNPSLKRGEPVYKITDRGVNWIATYLG